MSCKPHTALSGVTSSAPPGTESSPVECLPCTPRPVSHVVAAWVTQTHLGGVPVNLFSFHDELKARSGDAGGSEMPQRSCKVLPLREKVKVWCHLWFQAPTGGLGTYPSWTRGTAVPISPSEREQWGKDVFQMLR